MLPLTTSLRTRRVVGMMVLSLLLVPAPVAPTDGAEPNAHFIHQGAMPPGAIGRHRLARGGPVGGYFQPAEIQTPNGVSISLAEGGTFSQSKKSPFRAGLLIGAVYRLRLSELPNDPGSELFPTVELIDRLYPPPGFEYRFPIVVQITREDIQLARDGKMVTRVVYVEDPCSAIPATEPGEGGHWFDVGPGDDPLVAADTFGRPVAILRMGGRVPDVTSGGDPQFFFGCPPFVRLEMPEPSKDVPMPETEGTKPSADAAEE
jgi:hypothetical protein